MESGVRRKQSSNFRFEFEEGGGDEFLERAIDCFVIIDEERLSEGD